MTTQRERSPHDTARREQSDARRKDTREKLIERLRLEDAYDLAKMLEACGETIALVCTSCGTRKSAEKRCKKRWCPSCAYFIAAERVAKYGAAAERFKWPLFMTLTVRNTPDPESLRKLKKDWGKFRRRKLIREKVKSGIVGFEMTNKGSGWHPHLHALLDCRWLSLHVPEPNPMDNAEKKAAKCKAAAEELGKLWCDVIGQKTASVMIRRGDPAALVEVLKYSCKGSELLECSDRVADLIAVMQGMRLMTTFGDIRKEMQDQDCEEEEIVGCGCENCGGIGTLIPQKIYEHMLRQSFDKRTRY